MNTLIRNSTLAISRRSHGFNNYEVLADQSVGEIAGRAPRSSSKAKRERQQQQHIIASFSYRREQAKKRQIYLQSYKFSKETRTECTSRVLKKGFGKVKSALVKILAIVRIDSLRNCGVNKIPTICSSSPVSI
ncbi:hypothetical protein FRX31_020156 [Thalictrum thalictroides]|uniref:Uncharacterized protein n=1 Tax=Thalictrum thalictroides TaxID=46969 RepID=A0A7J6VZY0_THATH|nr:hypothetical protein FRX31_020156 [Thalictrum thalictroides]